MCNCDNCMYGAVCGLLKNEDLPFFHISDSLNSQSFMMSASAGCARCAHTQSLISVRLGSKWRKVINPKKEFAHNLIASILYT